MPNESCPPSPLRGVYHPYRLHVLRTCRWYVGTVVRVISEQDGDHHVDVAPARGYARYLDHDISSLQHGQLVAAIMPGQLFRMPLVGERIALFGTWVCADHGRKEIHRIWAIKYLDAGRVVYSLPVVPPHYGGGGVGGDGGGGGEDCDPNYVVTGGPRLQDGIGDYDGYGGSGDGPNYTPPGALIRVVGVDVFRLDSEYDGIACE